MVSEVVKVRRNIFGCFRQHSKVFGKSSEIFGSRWDIFENPNYVIKFARTRDLFIFMINNDQRRYTYYLSQGCFGISSRYL